MQRVQIRHSHDKGGGWEDKVDHIWVEIGSSTVAWARAKSDMMKLDRKA